MNEIIKIMKITVDQLRKIIREEVETLREGKKFPPLKYGNIYTKSGRKPEEIIIQYYDPSDPEFVGYDHFINGKVKHSDDGRTKDLLAILNNGFEFDRRESGH